MKTVILIIILFTAVVSRAQSDNGYTGKAKTFADKFWALVEELKKADAGNAGGKIPSYKTILDKARVQLRYVKEKDPSYNTNAMEQALKPWEDGLTDALQLKKAEFELKSKQGNKEGDGLASLFMASVTTGISGTGEIEADIAKHKTLIQVYQEKVEKILATGPPQNARVNEYVNNMSKPAAEQIKKLESDVNKAAVAGGLFYYRELVGIEVYWTAAKRLLQNVSAAPLIQQQAATALQRLGTEEQVRAKIEANRLGQLKNRKMPAAVKKDAVLEQKFKTHFGNLLAVTDKYKNETIIKVNILDNDWTIIRNQYTGIIAGRTISAAIATKKPEGKYSAYLFVRYIEDYDGSKYIGGKCDSGYQWPEEILPENIK